MKKQLFTLIILLAGTTLYAKQYPDSVCAASKAEYRIKQGLNIDISGGAGLGRFGFGPLFGNYAAPHSQNEFAYPLWNGAVGINYYFLPWMGVGTGVQMGTYANTTKVVTPWTFSGTDAQGDKYTMTSTPVGITEREKIYMMEIPLTLRFRAIKRNVGFHGALGVKFGLPIKNYYQLGEGALIDNSVYYPDFDLLINKDIAGMLKDIPVSPVQKEIAGLSKFNYGGYAEIGLLFRVHQRIDLMLAVAGTYYLNNMAKGASTGPLGFNDPSFPTNYYPSPFTTAYDGVLSTDEVQQLHPWNVMLKLGLSINAGKTDAKHAYDDPEWAARKAACEAAYKAKRAGRNVPAEPEPVASESEPQGPTAEELEAARVAEEHAQAAKAAEEAKKAEEARIAEQARLAEEARVAEETRRAEEARAKEEAKRVEEQRDAEVITHAKVTAYKLNSHELSEESKSELNHAATVLAKHPNWSIEVRGHCCDLGTERANNKIGLERANEAKKYLVKQGVDESRITVTSMGSTQPLVPNDSPEHRAQNRRVEIVINK